LVFSAKIWQSMSAVGSPMTITNNNNTPILCIAGPTASGKSALALAYAQARAAQGQTVEMICVDSATIYRGMDVGTAKPSAAEQAITPHHLIDIRDPSQSYSAGEFARDATRLIGEIRARGAQPVLVGGTMLYFKALLEGIDDLPLANPKIRAEIDLEATNLGWPALHAALALVDPDSAARLSPNDSQRIQRALEVYRATGLTLSSFFKKKSGLTDALAGASTDPLTSAPQATPKLVFQLVALEPQDRRWLHDRIAARFDAMLLTGSQNSLIEEVRALKARPDLHADLPAIRCVGYRQVWDFLDGAGSQKDWHDMRERGVAATRQLAKRQLTWLRGWQGKMSLHAETSCLANLATLLAH
jgi:tRNA dimethylallyltransferase